MLASKVSCLLIVSLAFILGALLAVSSQGQDWAEFQRKHMDNNPYLPINPRLYCEKMMRFRDMTYPVCKPHNTFINAPDYTVQQVCQYIRGPSVITSRLIFNLVDCLYTSGFPPLSCNYRGIVLSSHIRVTCENYEPVHFNEIVREAKK